MAQIHRKRGTFERGEASEQGISLGVASLPSQNALARIAVNVDIIIIYWRVVLV